MNKPDLLRELIANTLPFFHRNPDRLQLFISEGKIRCTNATSLSYEYQYQLEVVVEDYPEHPDTLVVPVLAFLKQHQNELLANPNRQEIQFEVEANNNATADIYLKIPLTERVIVSEQEGSYQIKHGAEPTRPDWQPIERLQVYLQGELIFATEREQSR